jgi:hypothetical protein
VTVAEHLASYLTQAGWRVTATHRELAREGIMPRQDRRTEISAAPPENRALSNPES